MVAEWVRHRPRDAPSGISWVRIPGLGICSSRTIAVDARLKHFTFFIFTLRWFIKRILCISKWSWENKCVYDACHFTCIVPNWKNKSEQTYTCPRGMEAQFRVPLKLLGPSQHSRDEGFRMGPSPIPRRDVSLSDSVINFFPSGHNLCRVYFGVLWCRP